MRTGRPTALPVRRVRGVLRMLRFCCATAVSAAVIAGFGTQAAVASDAPKVVITSRVPGDETTHVIGFLEGTDLKFAGIFDHGEKLKDIQVSETPGSQRVNFDFAIEAPSPTMIIEVTDGLGRSAAARVAADGSAAPAAEPDGSSPAASADESSAKTEPSAAPSPESSGNTAEIPRYSGGATQGSESHRRFAGGVGSRMTQVHIGIMTVLPVMSQPGSYEVTGQIAGAGVHRAGIYVGGRPVKPIPVAAGALSPFDVVFPLTGGRDATIRAYGAGNNFVEMPIDLNGAPAMGNDPYARS